ncbi:MAG: DUF6438 domain-containing protein [bacterium]|nr:DUF6438 domain-containing protein [bacterium]
MLQHTKHRAIRRLLSVAFICIAVIAATSGCSSSACLNDIDLRGFSIVFEKGACFGQCPTYRATITGERKVEFTTIAFVDPPRAEAGTIEDKTMCEILSELTESGFSTTQSVMAPVADAPVTRITVKRGSLTHMVEWNLGVPKNLRKLHDLLEANTYRNPTLIAPEYK